MKKAKSLKVKPNLKRSEDEPDKVDTDRRVSGEPDSHLAGVGAGGIAGAAAGAVIGTGLGGPVGGAIGAAVGALAGATAGEGTADILDPNVEEAYWKENFTNSPLYKEGDRYEDYLPAYRYGWENALRKEFENRDFDEIEAQLQENWRTSYPDSKLEWEEIRERTRDAYQRIRSKTLAAANK